MEFNAGFLNRVFGFSDIITQVFDLVRETFRTTIVATIKVCGPWLVMTAILMAFSISWFIRLFTGLSGAEQTAEWDASFDSMILSSLLIGLGILLVLVVLYAIAAAFQTCVTYITIKHLNETGHLPTYDEVKASIKKRFWKVVLGMIVSTIIINTASQFFYLPGIFVSVPLSIMVAGIIADNLDLGTALSASFKLIKNRWWFSFGVLVVSGLAQVAAASILMLPVVVILIGLYALGYWTDLSSLSIVIGALGSIIMIVAYTFANFIGQVAHMVLYYSHRERNNGQHLMQRIEHHFPLANTDGVAL